jgi:hypothetical protein
VIECVLRHPPPYANVDRKSMSTQEWRALRKIPPPPPPHVTAVGYPVEVIGKVMQFHGERRLTAISMSTSPPSASPSVTSPHRRRLRFQQRSVETLCHCRWTSQVQIFGAKALRNTVGDGTRRIAEFRQGFTVRSKYFA